MTEQEVKRIAAQNKVWVYDWETYKTFACVTFYSPYSKKHYTFEISERRCDTDDIIRFIEGKTLVGYNSKTFDNIVTNCLVKHPSCEAGDLYKIAAKIIALQKRDEDQNKFYKVFRDYLNSPLYSSIDLMRLLFSKKLRVGLKELECSLNHYNVEELPYPFDAESLSHEQMDKIIQYNINDCEATTLVFNKSLKALKLRDWMKKTYGIDGYSLDGVNAGVKILEQRYAALIGDDSFRRDKTMREWIHIKDIILPIVKFDTKEFNDVLEVYKKHTWYSSHYDKELFEDSGLLYEPLINDFKFKFSLGGLHGYTQAGHYSSNDEYDVISIDVASYYPSQVIEWKFVPGHLDTEAFLTVYKGVKDERIAAKASGDDTKNETLKLSINGAFGNFGNFYSWLFDHKVRLQICVNGQLMLAMLIEKMFKEGIKLIDANTDGIYVYLHKSKREVFNSIIKEWQSITRMEMEETKFEDLWMMNTADYFGTYLDKKGSLKTKEKGMFISELQLGKGMEFPVIAQAVKEHFLNKKDFVTYIKQHNNILDFCSYKKLNRDYTCYWKAEKQQRVNRFYASRNGAHLYKETYVEKSKRMKRDHVLKDSPVMLLNKYNDINVSSYKDVNYSFYVAKARKMIFEIEKNKIVKSLF